MATWLFNWKTLNLIYTHAFSGFFSFSREKVPATVGRVSHCRSGSHLLGPAPLTVGLAGSGSLYPTLMLSHSGFRWTHLEAEGGLRRVAAVTMEGWERQLTCSDQAVWSGVYLLHSSLGRVRQVTAILIPTSDEAASWSSCLSSFPTSPHYPPLPTPIILPTHCGPGSSTWLLTGPTPGMPVVLMGACLKEKWKRTFYHKQKRLAKNWKLQNHGTPYEMWSSYEMLILWNERHL